MMQDQALLSCDTETTYTDREWERYLIGIAIANEKDEYYIPLRHKIDLFGNQNLQGELNPEFLKDNTLIFHNSKFDRKVLRRAGFLLSDDYHDTLAMSWLLDENPPHGLKELAAIVLKQVETKKDKDTIAAARKAFGQEGVPVDMMSPYACKDARWTYDLFPIFWAEIQKGLTQQYKEMLEWQEVLMGIEEMGVRVDTQKCMLLSIECEAQLLTLKQELGFDPGSKKALSSKLFSLPPIGLGLKPPPPKKTAKTDAPSLDAAFLESVKHPLTESVLHYRRIQKAKSTYYGAYTALASPQGRLHATFLPTGTVTGRLSCHDPNLQQIPRELEAGIFNVKSVFLGDPDCELWELDYSNIEYRLASIYAKEQVLIDGFKRNFDYHSHTATLLGLDRQTAKITNFLILYGGGVRKLSLQLGISLGYAKEILEKHRLAYPGLARVARESATIAEQRGYVKTWTGRRRRFQYSSESYKAFNSVIQGGAADVLRVSTVNLISAGIDVRSLIHDAVWINVHPSAREETLNKATSIMEDWTEEKFGLRLSTDRKRIAA